MKISIAQINPIAGRISANIEKHISFVTLAAASGAGSVFFPELSLTGYEPRLAKELATHPYDIRFDEFQKLSNAKKMPAVFQLLKCPFAYKLINKMVASAATR